MKPQNSLSNPIVAGLFLLNGLTPACKQDDKAADTAADTAADFDPCSDCLEDWAKGQEVVNALRAECTAALAECEENLPLHCQEPVCPGQFIECQAAADTAQANNDLTLDTCYDDAQKWFNFACDDTAVQ